MPQSNPGQPKCAFVFAVAGERHVAGLAEPLRFLKRFSRAQIIVVQTRSALRALHDHVIKVEVPSHLDDHQASIALKTNLLEHVGHLADRFCYLDSDVIAVRDDVDEIFDYLDGPLRFASDHVAIDVFSHWAVNCLCQGPRCHHLREAILCSLDVDIKQCDWMLWNGGVFVFDSRAREFLQTWHDMALQIFTEDYWLTRDQGVLVATAWKLGMQDLPPLPSEFNFIVDRMKGIPVERRASATLAEFHLRNDYSLCDEPSRLQPRLIHFINGGVGQKGWRHWDDVSALLADSAAQREHQHTLESST